MFDVARWALPLARAMVLLPLCWMTPARAEFLSQFAERHAQRQYGQGSSPNGFNHVDNYVGTAFVEPLSTNIQLPENQPDQPYVLSVQIAHSILSLAMTGSSTTQGAAGGAQVSSTIHMAAMRTALQQAERARSPLVAHLRAATDPVRRSL